MTTDLVTYYGQTPIIDQLVDKYGVYLEKLGREDKLLLRMALANYVFMQEHSNPDKYTVEMALEDVMSDPGFIKKDWYDICSTLNGLTTLEAETLLEALQHQIRWGNARQVVS